MRANPDGTYDVGGEDGKKYKAVRKGQIRRRLDMRPGYGPHNLNYETKEVWFPGSHYDIGRQNFVLFRSNRGWLFRCFNWLNLLRLNVNYKPALANLPLKWLLWNARECDEPPPAGRGRVLPNSFTDYLKLGDTAQQQEEAGFGLVRKALGVLGGALTWLEQHVPRPLKTALEFLDSIGKPWTIDAYDNMLEMWEKLFMPPPLFPSPIQGLVQKWWEIYFFFPPSSCIRSRASCSRTAASPSTPAPTAPPGPRSSWHRTRWRRS